MESLADVLGVQDPQHPDKPVAPAPDPEMTAESFCRDILNTVQYRESLLRRIIMDELPPAVECMLYERAYGKTPSRMEHTGKGGMPIVTEVRRVIVHVAEQQDEQEKEETPVRRVAVH